MSTPPGLGVDRPELDLELLLTRLTARGVDYVIIGGIAAVLHGSPRNTFDLDVCFATDAGNLEALGDVLVGLEARLTGVPEDVPFVPDARTLRSIEVLTLTTPHGRLDVLAKPAGGPTYSRLRKNARRMDIGGVSVLVASIDDLIAMKSASGRPKDRADVAELKAIRRLERG